VDGLGALGAFNNGIFRRDDKVFAAARNPSVGLYMMTLIEMSRLANWISGSMGDVSSATI
jgi:hypothetical protein